MIGGLMRALHGPVYRSRLAALLDAIVPHLRQNDQLLDVGCGNGTLAAAIKDDPRTPAGVVCRGLESRPRGDEPIEVIGYDGKTIPLEDNSVDVVIVADVLHHENEPNRLADECTRISRRLFIVKDHQVKGVLAQSRISFIDWAANAPYGVPCLYRYNTPTEWTAFRERLGASADEERSGMKVYPPLFEQFFGGSLHYFAALRVDSTGPES
ncbi:MAG: methyltransferase domain-containing protein [Planctomycetota bacterium]